MTRLTSHHVIRLTSPHSADRIHLTISSQCSACIGFVTILLLWGSCLLVCSHILLNLPTFFVFQLISPLSTDLVLGYLYLHSLLVILSTLHIVPVLILHENMFLEKLDQCFTEFTSIYFIAVFPSCLLLLLINSVKT